MIAAMQFRAEVCAAVEGTPCPHGTWADEALACAVATFALLPLTNPPTAGNVALQRACELVAMRRHLEHAHDWSTPLDAATAWTSYRACVELAGPMLAEVHGRLTPSQHAAWIAGAS